MLTRDEFARQVAWPRKRVHGWAPGSYSCTCGDCGVHYLGDKRSVQCYPCAAKFVPPPRPETPEEIRADRARLASELQAKTAELDRVRSALSAIWPFVEEDDGGWTTPQYQAAIDQVRAALATMEKRPPAGSP